MGGTHDLHERLGALSSGARRLIESLALLDAPARWAVLRHIVRVTEEDLVEDLKEAVQAGFVAPVPKQPELYVLTDPRLRDTVLDGIGEARLPKLRARVEAARRRVEGR